MVIRCITHAVIASAAKQSIFRSIHLKEDGLPRPRRANARIRVVRMHASA